MIELATAGFTPLAVMSTSVLLSADWPRDELDAAEARRQAIMAALSMYARLDRFGDRDRSVEVRFCLHAGEVVVTEDGTAVGGNVLDLSSCVSETADQGVYASPAMLEGLGFASQRAAGAPGAWIPMRRVLVRPPPGGSTEPA